jgi:hypothetical protein
VLFLSILLSTCVIFQKQIPNAEQQQAAIGNKSWPCIVANNYSSCTACSGTAKSITRQKHSLIIIRHFYFILGGFNFFSW